MTRLINSYFNMNPEAALLPWLILNQTKAIW